MNILLFEYLPYYSPVLVNYTIQSHFSGFGDGDLYGNGFGTGYGNGYGFIDDYSNYNGNYNYNYNKGNGYGYYYSEIEHSLSNF